MYARLPADIIFNNHHSLNDIGFLPDIHPHKKMFKESRIVHFFVTEVSNPAGTHPRPNGRLNRHRNLHDF